MTRVEFKVYGTPVGQGRPRFTRTGRVYTPKATAKWVRHVKDTAEDVLRYLQPGFPAEAPVEVLLQFAMPIPLAWPKWKREAAERGQVAPMGKPDADNLAKAVLDGLNGVLFRDDAQVVRLTVHKVYATPPSVGVFIKATALPFPIASTDKRNPAKESATA